MEYLPHQGTVLPVCLEQIGAAQSLHHPLETGSWETRTRSCCYCRCSLPSGSSNIFTIYIYNRCVHLWISITSKSFLTKLGQWWPGAHLFFLSYEKSQESKMDDLQWCESHDILYIYIHNLDQFTTYNEFAEHFPWNQSDEQVQQVVKKFGFCENRLFPVLDPLVNWLIIG